MAAGTWRDVTAARRVLVHGVTGSGKSTFASQLGQLGRLVRRTAKGIVTKEERCNGNSESLRNAFSRDSIVRWHFSSWRRKRDTMRAWYATRRRHPSSPPVVLLGRPRDADDLVAMLHT